MSVYRKGHSGAWNGEIGPLLRRARQRRGLSLKEAEQSTSIRARYLEGLERENPKELPDKNYVQGFLRSYAEFLDLDVEELGRRFKSHHGGRRQRRQRREPAGESSAEGPAGAPRRPGFRRPGGALLTLSLAALALVLVVAAFYLFGRDASLSTRDGSDGGVPAEEEEAGKNGQDGSPAGGEEPAAEAGVPSGEAPAIEESSGTVGVGEMRLTVSVRGAESWILVETDSGVEYTGIARPGFSRSFESERSLRIATGNAGAVQVEINGQRYGTLGEDGEVTSRSFILKSAG